MSRNNKKERSKDSNISKDPVPTLKLKDEFEEKLIKALNGVADKSTQTRCLALQAICEALVHRCIPALVEEHISTLKNATEKSLLHGKDAEQLLGAKLAPLLVLQLGDTGRSMHRDLNRYLFTTVQDESVSVNVRAKCCTALGLLNFLGHSDCGQILPVMQFFEEVFSPSCLRSNKRSPVSVNAETANLHAEALSSWAVLLTASKSASSKIRLPLVEQLVELLESPYLEVRVTAGETLCLIRECGHSQDADFLSEVFDGVIDTVQHLATDSSKYRAKRDRKSQRASFRDMLRYLKDGTGPEINVRFGTESLVLNSWTIYFQYSALCTLVGPGMTYQLQKNVVIREIFQLGRKIGDNPALKGTKQPKLKPELLDAAVPRQRSRPKNLDNRSADKTSRNGKGAELLWSAKLSSLLELLLDGDVAIFKRLDTLFNTTVWTWRISNEVRAKCCIALGLLYLPGDNEIDSIKKIIINLEELYRGSYILGYFQTPEISTLYTAALFTWALLLIKLPAEEFVCFMNDKKPTNRMLLGKVLVRLLMKSNHLDVRMTAAEAVALIMERGRLYDRNYLSEYVDDFVVAIRQLDRELPDSATWYGPKRDVDFQRTILRKVIKYLQDDIAPEISVFVDTECLILDSWATYFKYSALCVEIGADMTSFLLKNDVIPDSFIQKVVTSPQEAAKQTKAEVDLLKAVAFKQRTLTRGENRDKRSAIYT